MRVGRRDKLGVAYRIAVIVLWPLLRTCIKWDIRGSEKLTNADGGAIVAPNHTSWFDPLVVSYALWRADRPPRFMAKESLFRIPVVGRVIRSTGQIPVFRNSSQASAAIRGALDALEAGEAVVVYPEGTMTRDPNLWPMAGKTGAVRLALASHRPLFPMVQWGTHRIMRPYAKELKLFPRKRITVVFGDPVDLSDLAGTRITGSGLHAGTDRLMDEITALQAEVRGERPPVTRVQSP